MSNLRELEDGTIQKQCTHCKNWWDLASGFSLRSKSSTSFYSWCRRCMKENTIKRQYKNGKGGDWFAKRYG